VPCEYAFSSLPGSLTSHPSLSSSLPPFKPTSLFPSLPPSSPLPPPYPPQSPRASIPSPLSPQALFSPLPCFSTSLPHFRLLLGTTRVLAVSSPTPGQTEDRDLLREGCKSIADCRHAFIAVFVLVWPRKHLSDCGRSVYPSVCPSLSVLLRARPVHRNQDRAHSNRPNPLRDFRLPHPHEHRSMIPKIS